MMFLLHQGKHKCKCVAVQEDGPNINLQKRLVDAPVGVPKAAMPVAAPDVAG